VSTSISVEFAVMSRRINVLIDEDAWGFLEMVPVGERDRVVNEALRSWVARGWRQDGVRETDLRRAELSDVTTDEVDRWIREDRERGL
jgi:hypothetical protein